MVYGEPLLIFGGDAMGARSQKEQEVAELSDKLARVKGAVLTEYRGLNVSQITRLRRKLRDAGVEYRVVKNTLLRLAARQAGLAGLDPYLAGPTAVAFGYQDPVSPARVLSEFAREFKQLAIKAGVLEGKIIDREGVRFLAELPSRELLLARVLGGMKSPLAGLAVVLNAPLQGLARVLQAVREQKESATAGA